MAEKELINFSTEPSTLLNVTYEPGTDDDLIHQWNMYYLLLTFCIFLYIMLLSVSIIAAKIIQNDLNRRRHNDDESIDSGYYSMGNS